MTRFLSGSHELPGFEGKHQCSVQYLSLIDEIFHYHQALPSTVWKRHRILWRMPPSTNTRVCITRISVSTHVSPWATSMTRKLGKQLVVPSVEMWRFTLLYISSPEVSRERFIAAPQAVPASDQPFPSIAPSTPILHHTIPIKAVARRSPCKAAKTSSPIAIPRLTYVPPFCLTELD